MHWLEQMEACHLPCWVDPIGFEKSAVLDSATTQTTNKLETAQVAAISMAQKQQKDLKVSSILFYSTRKTQKSNQISAPFGIF